MTGTDQRSLDRYFSVRFILLALAFSVTLSTGGLLPALAAEPVDWPERAQELRQKIAKILTLPSERIPLDAVIHRTRQEEEYSVESLTYASEPGSRVTALLYLPKDAQLPVPAVVLACGHGGSKSCFYAQYAGQLYAKQGFACFVPDTIGEEEREASGRMGVRGHDLYPLKEKNPEFIHTQLKRSVLGKIVWDLMRGLDYLETRREVDGERIGIAGYSLGGTSAGCVAMLDDRVRASLICGWVFRARYAVASKYCTRLPHGAFNTILGYDEMTALVAPHAPTLYMCGMKDAVIDSDEDGAAVVRDLSANVTGANRILTDAGIEGTIETELVPGSGHRPFFLSHRGVSWMREHLMRPDELRILPQKTIAFGKWVDSQGQQIESLYNTERNERGLIAVDCDAVLFDRKELACFPNREDPAPEYTMQGWTTSEIKRNKERPTEPQLKRWLGPQNWTRDCEGPIVSLGNEGAFDDTHLFAPAVALENGRFQLLYCGSQGRVQDRIFKLGLSTSSDGVHFTKSDASPIYAFGDGRHSVLTPTFLRGDDGVTLRENGMLRLWFSAADLTVKNPPHSLRHCRGKSLATLSEPSDVLLSNVYAPTVIKDGDAYRVWYSDVSAEPWTIRHAYSHDGIEWFETPGPVIVIDQTWEKNRLFYPTVVKTEGVYVMWYGAYWSGHDQMTALGCAVSQDGLIWYKHPQNPVFRPDPSRSWESHYTTSQSVMRLQNGSWRIWYATRKAPPHVNKYFAAGTASWAGPGR